jgi:hypothetical protein
MKCAILATFATVAAAGGNIPLTWNDCSDETYKTKITSLTPDSLTIGTTTTITGTGHLLEDITEDVTFDGKLTLKLTDCSGSASVGKSCNFPMDTGKIGFAGIDFPVKAGEIPIEVDLKISKILPADYLTAIAEVTAISKSKGTVFCLEVYTKKSPDSHFGVGILDVTWSDCGDAHDALVIVDTLEPNQIKQGEKTVFIGKGDLPMDIEEDDITFHMKLKVQLLDCNGKASETKKCKLPLDLGFMEFQGIPTPILAGDTAINVDMKLSNLIPSAIVDSTTHVTAKTASGENVFCVNVITTPTQDDAVQV